MSDGDGPELIRPTALNPAGVLEEALWALEYRSGSDRFFVELGPSLMRTRAVLGTHTTVFRNAIRGGYSRREADEFVAEAAAEEATRMDPDELVVYEGWRDAEQDRQGKQRARGKLIREPGWDDPEAVDAWREAQVEEHIREEEAAEEDACWLCELDPEERAEEFRFRARRAQELQRRQSGGRGAGGQTARSHANLWDNVMTLPWQLLGNRPVMVTATAPREWRRRWADGRAFQADVDAFVERWAAHFGERPLGLWVKEFQPRERRPLREQGAPHLHMLVKLPDCVPDEDYRGLQERTLLGKRMEREKGTYEGRRLTPPIGGRYGGGTAEALRRWWSQIVTDGEDRTHAERGVDVRVVFYVPGAELTPRARVAAYLAGEVGKWRQKRPPYGYDKVGRYWGIWGKDRGFVPQMTSLEVDRAVFVELTRRMNRWHGWRREVGRRKGWKVRERGRQWELQGARLGGVGPEGQARLLRWATAAADRRR